MNKPGTWTHWWFDHDPGVDLDLWQKGLSLLPSVHTRIGGALR